MFRHAMVPRLHLDQRLACGTTIVLTAPTAHYLRHVLRLQPGAALCVFNARDGAFDGHIAGWTRSGGTAAIGQATRAPQPEAELWLIAAIVKRHAFEWLVEKATEIGATRLSPLMARRSVTHSVNAARLTAIATEAAEQCHRLSVPAIDPPQPLAAVLAQWPSDRHLVWGDETGNGQPIRALAEAGWPARPALLVGPEGGFDPAELDALRAFPQSSALDLGPTILRAETAALVGLTLVREWFRPAT